MGVRRFLLVLATLLPIAAHAAQTAVHLELNALEPAGDRCRTTFVVANKGESIESLKLDTVIFNTENIVFRRILTEMGPLRAGRTMVRTFVIDTPCDQIGAVLINEVSSCAPGDPNSCLDGLELSSRVKNVRLYK